MLETIWKTTVELLDSKKATVLGSSAVGAVISALAGAPLLVSLGLIALAGVYIAAQAFVDARIQAKEMERQLFEYQVVIDRERRKEEREERAELRKVQGSPGFSKDPFEP